MCPAFALSLLGDLCQRLFLQTRGESQTQPTLLQLTPIGLTLLNNALVSFSFANTFLSLGEPLSLVSSTNNSYLPNPRKL